MIKSRIEGVTDTGGASISQDIFCQDCGYNLRALTGERCPECGRSLEGLRSEVSKIPWVHRKEIGRFRAYGKTVWFVMFRQRQFFDEMARPVSYADSQRFRWVTVALAYLPVLACEIVLGIQRMESPTDNEIISFLWSDVRMILALHVGFLLFLAAATGVPSYFFQPNAIPMALQNRTIALSYYTSAPICFFFLPSVAFLILLNEPHNDDLAALAALLTFIFAIMVVGIWWVDLDHLLLRLLPGNRARTVITTLTLPLLWLLLFATIMVLVPLVILYVTIIASSLF